MIMCKMPAFFQLMTDIAFLTITPILVVAFPLTLGRGLLVILTVMTMGEINYKCILSVTHEVITLARHSFHKVSIIWTTHWGINIPTSTLSDGWALRYLGKLKMAQIASRHDDHAVSTHTVYLCSEVTEQASYQLLHICEPRNLHYRYKLPDHHRMSSYSILTTLWSYSPLLQCSDPEETCPNRDHILQIVI